MPQLDSGEGGAGGGDDLGAPDELLAFQDEGEEQDDKNRDSAAGPERDLAELKSSLVNESEGAAAGAGGPGAHGQAEVGAEVSAGLRQPLPRGPRGPHHSEPLPGPKPRSPSVPCTPHCLSASLSRLSGGITLRRDFSQTNFQSPWRTVSSAQRGYPSSRERSGLGGKG
jgi:hypothetical protein